MEKKTVEISVPVVESVLKTARGPVVLKFKPTQRCDRLKMAADIKRVQGYSADDLKDEAKLKELDQLGDEINGLPIKHLFEIEGELYDFDIKVDLADVKEGRITEQLYAAITKLYKETNTGLYDIKSEAELKNVPPPALLPASDKS